MKFNTKSLLIAVSLLGVVTLSSAVDLKQSIQSIYDKISTLTMKKDLNALRKEMISTSTKDFVYVAKNAQPKDIAALTVEMKEQFKVVKKFNRNVNRIEKLTVTGKTAKALVTGLYKIEIITPDKKLHVVSGISRTMDTWVKVGSEWKIREIRVLGETVTMDGKPLPTGG